LLVRLAGEPFELKEFICVQTGTDNVGQLAQTGELLCKNILHKLMWCQLMSNDSDN